MDGTDLTDPLPVAPPDEDAPTEPTAPPTRRRSRLGIAMVAIGAVLVLAAIPIAVVGFGAQSDASDEREAAFKARDARPPLEEERHSLDERRIALAAIVDALPDKMEAIGTAAGELDAAEQHFTDVVNHGAAVYNSGDDAGAAAVYRTDGQSALDALLQKNQAGQDALRQAHDAVTQLKEAK